MSASGRPNDAACERIPPHRPWLLLLDGVRPPMHDVGTPLELADLLRAPRVDRGNCRPQFFEEGAVFGRHRVVARHQHPIAQPTSPCEISEEFGIGRSPEPQVRDAAGVPVALLERRRHPRRNVFVDHQEPATWHRLMLRQRMTRSPRSSAVRPGSRRRSARNPRGGSQAPPDRVKPRPQARRGCGGHE
jgi:hypothetical protein